MQGPEGGRWGSVGERQPDPLGTYSTLLQWVSKRAYFFLLRILWLPHITYKTIFELIPHLMFLLSQLNVLHASIFKNIIYIQEIDLPLLVHSPVPGPIQNQVSSGAAT